MSTATRNPLQRVEAYIRGSNNSSKILLLPLLAFELVFFVIPVLYLVRISLYEQSTSGAYVGGTWSLSAYVDVLSSSYVHSLMAFTFTFAIVTTIVTVMAAIIYAYAIWRADGLVRTALLFAVVMPLLTTLVVRLYAWIVLLSPGGTVNDALIATSLISEPMALMNNTFGVVIGQTYIAFPYAVLAIFSVLSTMDWEIVEAARDLGASRPRSVWEVVIPQMIPGIVVGTVITFAWAVGAYAAPMLLGSGGETTFAMHVDHLMLTEFNWPAASALALIILALVLASVFLLFTFLNRWGGDVDYA